MIIYGGCKNGCKDELIIYNLKFYNNFSNNNKVRIYQNSKNMGAYYCRNRGIILSNGYYILSRDTTLSNGSIYLQSALPQSIAAYYYTPQVINTAIKFSTQVQFSLSNSVVGFQSNLISLLTQNSTITLVKSISNPTYWILTAYTGNIGFSSI